MAFGDNHSRGTTVSTALTPSTMTADPDICPGLFTWCFYIDPAADDSPRGNGSTIAAAVGDVQAIVAGLGWAVATIVAVVYVVAAHPEVLDHIRVDATLAR